MKLLKSIVVIIVSMIATHSAQSQQAFFLNVRIEFPTVLMSDGKIVPSLTGNYSNPIEYHFDNMLVAPIIFTDSLCNIADGMFNGPETWIYAVDQISGDTVGSSGLYSINGGNDIILTCDAIFNSSTLSSCDGTLNVVGPYIDYDMWLYWKPDFTTPGFGSDAGNQGGHVLINLCPGYYKVEFITLDGIFVSTFYLQPLGLDMNAFDLSVFATPTSNLCQGIAYPQIGVATPPFQYYWDGINGSAIKTDFCPGIHSLKVIDANSDSSAVMFGVADSANFMNYSDFLTSYDDTIYFMTENCGINYSQPIDSIAITFADFFNDSTVAMGFTIWQGTDTYFIQDTASYGPGTFGVFLVDLTQFCLNKSSGGNVFIFRDEYNYYLSQDEVNVDNFAVYPNPTNQFIQIEGDNIEKISIYNLLGELICTTTNRTIDVSEFPKGMYQVVLLGAHDNCLAVKKLLVN